MSSFGNALPASGERETRWLTPNHIVDSLGEFDLDPCGAPNHYLAKSTYLLERGEDGLTLAWSGRIWCNPPYGRESEPFLKRLADHGTGTALIFARTETRVFFEQVWQRATALLFVRGRIKFLRADLSGGGLQMLHQYLSPMGKRMLTNSKNQESRAISSDWSVPHE
ncbi:DNA N-6-adenine-methyltransferase [Aurantimicrobium minutum]|uniref:DNA N-6-adenine-methyltransferase n=1 Tax=Aurantimicrobium minutum TaxID=708131 RepID=UPI00247324B8|nr:DNA N-6-adenine-methyltransferase [Aurantimicrobium minutum]